MIDVRAERQRMPRAAREEATTTDGENQGEIAAICFRLRLWALAEVIGSIGIVLATNATGLTILWWLYH
jgi:hypothetical protein